MCALHHANSFGFNEDLALQDYIESSFIMYFPYASWILLFFFCTSSPASGCRGSSCSTSHLHNVIPMHIYTHSYQILFMRRSCSQKLSLIYPSNISRVLLIVTYL